MNEEFYSRRKELQNNKAPSLPPDNINKTGGAIHL